MAMGKSRRKASKSARRRALRKRDPVLIPVALMDGTTPSGAIEFTDVPESIQKRVEEILRAKGLISQSE
jgi:hypothetical protein